MYARAESNEPLSLYSRVVAAGKIDEYAVYCILTGLEQKTAYKVLINIIARLGHIGTLSGDKILQKNILYRCGLKL